MDVGKCAERLVGVEFDKELWYWLFDLLVVFYHSEYCFWDVIHHTVKVDLVFLVSLREESVSQIDYVRMDQLAHYLELPIFVSLVLINLLDGNFFSCFCHGRLKNDSKRSVTDNSICVVSETRTRLLPILRTLLSFLHLPCYLFSI